MHQLCPWLQREYLTFKVQWWMPPATTTERQWVFDIRQSLNLLYRMPSAVDAFVYLDTTPWIADSGVFAIADCRFRRRLNLHASFWTNRRSQPH